MTDQDRKDHELAAKAAGYVLTWKEGSCKGGAYCGAFIERGGELVAWNPKGDDGDAFRFAVKLKIDVMHDDKWDNDAYVMAGAIDHVEDVDGECNRPTAARLAVFRCAVEIGRAMQ